MVTITLTIPGSPVPKQSVKFSSNRYFQNGTHFCHWCKQNTFHQAGDVVTFRSKTSNKVDTIVTAYKDSKYTRLDKAIRMLVAQQLPKGFVMFDKEVHVDSCDFIFPIVSGMPKKVIQAIEEGEIVFRPKQPDIDNIFKPLQDSLTGLVWRDDSLIVSEGKIRKIYGVEPKTIITLTGE